MSAIKDAPLPPGPLRGEWPGTRPLWFRSLGSQMELAEEIEMGPSLSQLSPNGSRAFILDLETSFTVSSGPREGPMLMRRL